MLESLFFLIKKRYGMVKNNNAKFDVTVDSYDGLKSCELDG